MIAFRVLAITFGSHPGIHWTSTGVPFWVSPTSPWFDDRPRARITLGPTRPLDLWALTRYAVPWGSPPSMPVLVSLLAFLFGLCPLLLHLSWYIFCLHFGFRIFLRHLRWYLSPSVRIFLKSFFGVGSRTTFYLLFGSWLLLLYRSWSFVQRLFRSITLPMTCRLTTRYGESMASFRCLE